MTLTAAEHRLRELGEAIERDMADLSRQVTRANEAVDRLRQWAGVPATLDPVGCDLPEEE